MPRLRYSLLISLLFFSTQGIIAQIDSTEYYARKELAQKNFKNYQEKALLFEKQLNSIDSIYKAGHSLFETSETTFIRAKKAFKSMEINYKAQVLPYKKKAKSRDRKEATEARRKLQIIKARFQENGKETAQVANDASREMHRAEKMMERAQARIDLLIPRYKKIREEMEHWQNVLKEMETK